MYICMSFYKKITFLRDFTRSQGRLFLNNICLLKCVGAVHTTFHFGVTTCWKEFCGYRLMTSATEMYTVMQNVYIFFFFCDPSIPEN